METTKNTAAKTLAEMSDREIKAEAKKLAAYHAGVQAGRTLDSSAFDMNYAGNEFYGAGFNAGWDAASPCPFHAECSCK